MRSKRFVFAVSVIAVTTTLAFLLITAFVVAQTSSGTGAIETQAQDDAQASDLLATQEVSITFPPGDWPWYAQEEITVHPAPPVAGQPAEVCAAVINLDTENLPLFLERESKCDCRYCGTPAQGEDVSCRTCGAPLPDC